MYYNEGMFFQNCKKSVKYSFDLFKNEVFLFNRCFFKFNAFHIKKWNWRWFFSLRYFMKFIIHFSLAFWNKFYLNFFILFFYRNTNWFRGIFIEKFLILFFQDFILLSENGNDNIIQINIFMKKIIFII